MINLKPQLKAVFSWSQELFWLLIAMSLLGALTIYTFDLHLLVKFGIILVTMVKIIVSQKIIAATPSSAIDQDQYSWKFLQSLPISRRDLLSFMIICYVINLTPLMVWFLCFQHILASEILGMEDLNWFTSVKTFLFMIPLVVLGSIISTKNIIQFPRVQFVQKNRRVLNYQLSRDALLYIVGACYVLFIFTALSDYLDAGFVVMFKGTLQLLKPLWNIWVGLFLLILFVADMFRKTLKVWTNEKLSYIKINWKPKRDVPVIMVCLAHLLILPGLLDTAPIMYQDSELTEAVYRKNPERIVELLKAGADINQTSSKGMTPLMAAAHEGNVEIFKMLSKRGASHEGVAKFKKGEDEHHNGMNLFLLAIDGKNPEIVKLLVDTNNANTKHSEGYPALNLAAAQCQAEIIDILISHGADLKAVNKAGETALHVASRQNCFAAAVALVDAGVDPSAKDKKGKLAIDLIQKHKDLEYFVKKKTRLPANKI